MKNKPQIIITPTFVICWCALILIEPGVWVILAAPVMTLHEAGHLSAMLLTKTKIEKIRFRAAGMEIVRQPGLRSYISDAVVALAGPFFSLLGSLTLFCGNRFLRFFGAANLLLGILNLLPVCGLDGGEALYSLLCRRISAESAQKTVRILSFIFILPLWILAVWIMLMTGGNFSLFLVSAVLFVSVAFRL